jgi:hypothetical protein
MVANVGGTDAPPRLTRVANSTAMKKTEAERVNRT